MGYQVPFYWVMEHAGDNIQAPLHGPGKNFYIEVPNEQIHQCRLPCPNRSKQSEELLVANMEGYCIESNERGKFSYGLSDVDHNKRYG
jgi:hypothetical protein